MAGFKTIWATQTTDARTTDVEGVGRIRIEDDKIYRWVKNTVTNFTPAGGEFVCHLFTDGAISLQNISKPATATLGYLAGQACTTISASTGTNPAQYGWIQIFGLSTVTVTPVNTQTTAAPVAGASLVALNGVSTYLGTGTAMGTAPIYMRTVECLDSVTASTAAQTGINIFIRCL